MYMPLVAGFSKNMNHLMMTQAMADFAARLNPTNSIQQASYMNGNIFPSTMPLMNHNMLPVPNLYSLQLFLLSNQLKLDNMVAATKSAQLSVSTDTQSLLPLITSPTPDDINSPKKTQQQPLPSTNSASCFSVANLLSPSRHETFRGNEQFRGSITDGSSSSSESIQGLFENNHKDTIGYTMDALLLSDGRTKRRKNTSSSPDSTISPSATLNTSKHVCSDCGKSYATSSNLSRHKQTHRSLDSEHAKKCPHCERVYVSMPALSMHLLTHKAQHECGICGKVFSRPWLLQGHTRAHTGQKPFGCAHCGKAFADRSNLRAHMHTHSGVKKHKCDGCGKMFALKSYLNKHKELVCPKMKMEV